ncbi:MAG: bifunctional homocysteine S-methyltransferase/methylenetetrahydrofolate reductase [Fimbriimonadaceae bacterium]|nr:bifunctional homocysteine S-methyltransferase/methylenetetrahydrofolate reductase [Fimbriimonadaceae bacterium]
MRDELSQKRVDRLLSSLKDSVLLGDGANGTMLANYGFERQPYDLANLLAPTLVQTVHEEYFDAGADFVETNTFSANAVKIGGLNFDIAELNRKGASLARAAAGDNRLVLGAIGPCGKPLEPIGSLKSEEAFAAFAEQARALDEGGVDGFMLETFIDIEEMRIAAEAVASVSDLPIIISKAFIEDGDALAEGLPGRMALDMGMKGVVAVGANCVVGPQRMIDIVRQLSEASSLPILAMPTPGLPQLVKGQVVYDIAPDYFAKASVRLIEEGARIIGGCCGTTPEHTRKMREALNKGDIKPKSPSAITRQQVERKPIEESEPTELSEKLKKGKFIITVELDLPRGLGVEKVLKSARQLKIKGADLVDISDGARARLRMNPLSVCTLIQEQVGIETMMHFACRDRNLLAVQADLLGAHALGVRNILAITGDPANIGDYPSATSVYDVDAIGLVRILSRFNEGIDLAGYSVGVKCAFSIAIAFNPLAADMDLEMDRLARKIDAGAHLVYTQPLFEEEHIDRALSALRNSNLPLFVGVLPLKHTRHAEFMHNEVPGIEVPNWLREQLANAPTEDDGLRIGVEAAQGLAKIAKERARGLYLMPPFGSAAIAEQVIEATQ